jgi:2-C-methyl-D-erythritol 4-phosphate cytidylyltransferase/2-C-methyl-D-erythritol 2,4-cyclodiphosphate synthase
MHVTAIIAAGGRGQRFGSARPKQFLEIGGRPILERSVDAFVRHREVSAVIVALPQALAADPPAYLRRGTSIQVVVGGDRRQDSVANAFRAADPATEIIVIHDAARPFIEADLVTRTIAAAVRSGAALAAVASRDTVKRAGAASPRTVTETLPRDAIFLAQTPQAFRRDVLQRALEEGGRSGVDATDEATLVEMLGLPVQLVDGDASNIKITTPDDLVLGEAIAARREGSSRGLPARTGRAGTGYDLHRLVAGRPLILGGVSIPSPFGALGHSDADVVCHAVTDAILGAAALGDIGRHFPDTDPRWKDADSIELLRQVVGLVAAQGLMVGNVDVTVVLERPKISEHVAAMRASVAAAIGIDAARVSIKGKTNEGVDAIGRGEAVAAHAVALLRGA